MGNSIAYLSGDDDILEVPDVYGYNVIDFTVNEMDLQVHPQDYHRNNLPVIRGKPNLNRFQNTEMYKQIMSRCTLDWKPTERRWNLMQALQKRENGLAAPSTDSFSCSQQRYFANMYIPNQKSTRILSLDAKVFVTKFNKSGDKLITACQDGFVRIYDGSKGTYHLLNRIHARDVQWCITDADFSPDGQHFAYSTWSRSFFVMPLDSHDGDCQWIVHETSNNRVAVFSLRYSPTGDKIIGGSSNATVIVGDVRTRATQMLRTHRTPNIDVNAVSYVSDNDPNLIIAGCDDGLLKVYDLRTAFRGRTVAKSVIQFVGHYDGITYIDSRNDGCHVLTNSKDQSIKIWDLRQPSNTRNRNAIRQHQSTMNRWDYRWDRVPRQFYNPHRALEGDSSIMTYRGHRVTKTLLRAKFSPLEQTGQRFIYTGCGTGRIIIYDVLTGHIREAIEGHKTVVRDLDWHPVRSEIISSSWDTHVHLNSYKRNTAIQPTCRRRRSSVGRDNRPLRRSRRIANRACGGANRTSRPY
ncbi:CG9945 [Drosophila busckii]|uniref:CG9945 n=1 Tax=Drosophila busckii TaxID=30019 RepID=A0A0M4EUL9_DROBS|nr:DDB1- and CUL4-associated factor 11 [Drosophila busckii]ALC41425.1 CG9945 [Drosophila busckii]